MTVYTVLLVVFVLMELSYQRCVTLVTTALGTVPWNLAGKRVTIIMKGLRMRRGADLVLQGSGATAMLCRSSMSVHVLLGFTVLRRLTALSLVHLALIGKSWLNVLYTVYANIFANKNCRELGIVTANSFPR
jgi:hypothetical protein